MSDQGRDPGPRCPICHGPLAEAAPAYEDQTVFDCGECRARLIVPDCAWHIAVLMRDARRPDPGGSSRLELPRAGVAIRDAVWHVLL